MPELVVSRGHCRFGRFDLSRLPAAKRASALALQLSGWSPFVDSGYAIAWSADGQADVWCWDSAALRAAWQAAVGGKLPRLVPETPLRAAPANGEGLRLVRCLDGFEGQYWRDGQLNASRWWPAAPEASAQLAFQRDCGIAPDALQAHLAVEELPLQSKPWRPLNDVGGPSGQIAAPELAAYAVLALALGVPTLSLAVDEFRLSRARAGAQAELASETERSQGVLAARNEALTAIDQARALSELQPYPPPLVHMTAIARALPEAGGSVLKEWEMNEGKLRVLIASPSAEIAGAEHVRALEQTGLFHDVKILTQADPRQMAFTMSFKPQTALAAGAAASAP